MTAYAPLCTINQVKAWLKITTMADDGGIGPMINAASEMIGRFCNRENLGSVNTYTENYFKRTRYTLDDRLEWDLVLRHWPIVAVTSVALQSTPVPALSQAQISGLYPGFYVEEDNEPRILKIAGFYPTFPATVVYTAGYAQGSVPFGLQQAAIQLTAEMFRAEQWVDKKSVTVGGEIVAGDMGNSWGMSDKVKALLMPFRDVNPFQFR